MRLRADELVWQVVDSEIVVLDLRKSVYFRINGSGATLWEQLAGGTTRSDLEAALVDTYGIPPEEASADVDSFLEDTRQRGFLEE